jgi:hypothetical protein
VTEPLGKAVVEIIADRSALKTNLALAESEFKASMDRIGQTARAAQIFKETRTDFEKYRAAQSEINDLRKAGIGDAEALSRREQQLKSDFEKTTAAFRQRIEAERDAASIRGRHTTPEGQRAAGIAAARNAHLSGGLDSGTAVQEVQRLNAAYREQKAALDALDETTRLSKMTYAQLKAEQAQLTAQMKTLTAAFHEGEMSAENFNTAKRAINVSLNTIGQTFATGSNAASRYGMIMQQASFGAQDFLTVLSMGGGLNMALMSSANNMAQVAAMINPLKGAWIGLGITLGTVLIPHLVNGVQYLLGFGRESESASEAVEKLAARMRSAADAYEDFARAREMAFDVSKMDKVSAIDDEIEATERLIETQKLARAEMEKQAAANQRSIQGEAGDLESQFATVEKHFMKGLTGGLFDEFNIFGSNAEMEKRFKDAQDQREKEGAAIAETHKREADAVAKLDALRHRRQIQDIEERAEIQRKAEEKAAKDAALNNRRRISVEEDLASLMNPEMAEVFRIGKASKDRSARMDEAGIRSDDPLRFQSKAVAEKQREDLNKRFERDLLRETRPNEAKRQDIVDQLEERLKFISGSGMAPGDKRRQAEMAQQAAERGLGDIGRKKAEGPGFAGIADLSSQIQMAIKPKDSTAKAQESTAENTKKTAEYLKIVKEKVETLESGFGP